MNEQMESYYVKVIEQLAQKLGTTTEYLWQVLVNQAYIDGIIGIIYIILTILAGYGLYRLHKYFSSSDKYYEHEEVTYIIMAVGLALLAIVTLTVVFNIGNIITAFVHPEYWALQQILNLK